jgi:hypothetical protein
MEKRSRWTGINRKKYPAYSQQGFYLLVPDQPPCPIHESFFDSWVGQQEATIGLTLYPQQAPVPHPFAFFERMGGTP